jgi:hypothetical protein
MGACRTAMHSAVVDWRPNRRLERLRSSSSSFARLKLEEVSRRFSDRQESRLPRKTYRMKKIDSRKTATGAAGGASPCLTRTRSKSVPKIDGATEKGRQLELCYARRERS